MRTQKELVDVGVISCAIQIQNCNTKNIKRVNSIVIWKKVEIDHNSIGIKMLNERLSRIDARVMKIDFSI